MVLNGDVVSTGDIVNAGEIRFDNQTTPDAALSRAVAKGDSPVTFHKLTTSNLTGQGGTINMRVRLDGSNTSDQLVINGGQATGKTWLAFTNVGNSNLGVATSGQGTRSQLINSIDILRARRATGLMTRDNYRMVNNITQGKHPEAQQ
ncbi:TA system toxin CbtA family protein [Escherichia coli]|nr:TA system toxin CbtA family protein [Escherichia coli]